MTEEGLGFLVMVKPVGIVISLLDCESVDAGAVELAREYRMGAQEGGI